MEPLSARARERTPGAAVQHLGAASAGASNGDGQLRLLAPNRYVIDWLEQNSLPRIKELLRGVRRAAHRSRGGRLAGWRTAAPAAERPRTPCSAPASAAAAGGLGARQPHQPGFHLRQFRRGQEQPARQGGGHPGGGQSRQGLQPAVHLRRRRPRQDASHACRRRTSSRSAMPRRASPTCTSERFVGDMVKALQHNTINDFKTAYRIAGCADDRRHPVLRRQGALAGGILPHLQCAARRPATGDPHLRSLSEGGRRARGAPEIALRLGSDGRHRAAGAGDLRRDPDEQGARCRTSICRRKWPSSSPSASAPTFANSKARCAAWWRPRISPGGRSRWNSPRRRCATCWRFRKNW